MKDPLNIIKEIQATLNAQNVAEHRDQIWQLFDSLSSELEFDSKFSKGERDTLRQIKDWLSHGTLQINEGSNSVHFGSASPLLNALHTSISKRTIGPDGWPMA